MVRHFDFHALRTNAPHHNTQAECFRLRVRLCLDRWREQSTEKLTLRNRCRSHHPVEDLIEIRMEALQIAAKASPLCQPQYVRLLSDTRNSHSACVPRAPPVAEKCGTTRMSSAMIRLLGGLISSTHKRTKRVDNLEKGIAVIAISVRPWRILFPPNEEPIFTSYP